MLKLAGDDTITGAPRLGASGPGKFAHSRGGGADDRAAAALANKAERCAGAEEQRFPAQTRSTLAGCP